MDHSAENSHLLTRADLSVLRALVGVQFVLVCLGIMTLHILGNAGSSPDGPAFLDSVSAKLARHGWWLLLCPVLNAVAVMALLGRPLRRAVIAASAALAILLALIFGIPLLLHF